MRKLLFDEAEKEEPCELEAPPPPPLDPSKLTLLSLLLLKLNGANLPLPGAEFALVESSLELPESRCKDNKLDESFEPLLSDPALFDNSLLLFDCPLSSECSPLALEFLDKALQTSSSPSLLEEHRSELELVSPSVSFPGDGLYEKLVDGGCSPVEGAESLDEPNLFAYLSLSSSSSSLLEKEKPCGAVCNPPLAVDEL